MVNLVRDGNFPFNLAYFRRVNINALTAYLNERFPPINMALFAVLFGTVYSVAGYFWPAFNPLGFGWREGLGMVAVISFFFRLRVFDEIKDYDLDVGQSPPARFAVGPGYA